jgi:hypothetical protein
MINAAGLLACLVIAAVPAIVQPERHLAAAGVIAALICAGGLVLASLGVALVGSVAALLVFSVSLLMGPSTNAAVPAVLLGVALFVLLDATLFHLSFRKAEIGRPVTRLHLATLSASAILSIAIAGLIVAVGAALSFDLDPLFRPIVAAVGAILVMVTVLGATPRTAGAENEGAQ